MKLLMMIFVLLLMVVSVNIGFSQDVPAANDGLMAILSSIMATAAAKWPVFLSIVSFMGVMRLIYKPFFSFLHTFVGATVSKKDDAILEKVETSSIYKAIVYIIDLVGSWKIEKPVK